MKVMTWKEFAEMPDGTIFSYWMPCITSGLHRKHDTYYQEDGTAFDFVEVDLMPHVDDVYGVVMPTSEDIDIAGRYGGYDENQLFLVYEEADIKRFHLMLDNKSTEKLP